MKKKNLWAGKKRSILAYLTSSYKENIKTASVNPFNYNVSGDSLKHPIIFLWRLTYDQSIPFSKCS